MEKIVIVGSGASGVHFALSLLKKNYRVTMIDVGYQKPAPVNLEDTFATLKRSLPDPVEYFLGKDFEAADFHDSKREYYGFPPNKEYVFSRPSSFEYQARGFEPLVSFAQGGLAEAWTGGVYPLNDHDLADFPFSYREMEPFYGEVADRIGITGAKDDLERFYPIHDHLMEPLRLDDHSAQLLSKYKKQRELINGTLNCWMGRSRVAVISNDHAGRKACSYKGRCLWGCPTESLYTPSITLRQCMQNENFQYLSGMYVTHFKFLSDKIGSVVVESVDRSEVHEIDADRLVLAAGTLSTSKIFMESLWRVHRQPVKLTGLMDNRQVLIPFINKDRIGLRYDPDSYQYHQLALGIETNQPDQYLHGLITTLKTALAHPIIKSIPMDLRSAISMFRNVRAGLGLINLNFPDRRREENFVALEPGKGSGTSKLVIQYSSEKNESEVIDRAVAKVKKILGKLECIVPPGTVHVRPMGASVHYAGTIPMSAENRPFTSTEFCRSRDFENLYFVDGTTFPALPSKNLTFALMSNAIRIADHEF